MRGKARDGFTETRTALDLEAEGPLRRWARRRREVAREERTREEQAKARQAEAPADVPDKGAEVGASRGEASESGIVEEKPLTDEDMPPLDSLGEDSDYSGFLSPGVSEGLRRRALRKLFSSAVFNVPDGLDDYDDDFTTFAALGDIVTSDMKHQAEMEAERAKQARAGTEPAAGREDEARQAEGDVPDDGMQARTSAEVEDEASQAEDDWPVTVESSEPAKRSWTEQGHPDGMKGSDIAGRPVPGAPAPGPLRAGRPRTQEETTSQSDATSRSRAISASKGRPRTRENARPRGDFHGKPAGGEATSLAESTPVEKAPPTEPSIPASVEPSPATAPEDAAGSIEGQMQPSSRSADTG